jgi:G3E family GTPase
MTEIAKDNKIPVTIITGFLGSGKTTLLNNLIKKHTEKKFAIIENEFGEIGIDGGLIVGASDNIFELANGCICCSLGEGFYETIVQLLKNAHNFNHLLVETTGIADPDSIINSFIASEDMQARFKIDSVVCLADALHLEDLLPETPEVRKQLALSDIVLLNKIDEVGKEYALQLTKLIAEINPMAKVYPVSHASITHVNILDVFTFSVKEVEKSTLSFRNLTISNLNEPNLSSVLQKNTNTKHKHDIKSEGFSIPGSFNYEKFMYWMQNYLFFNRSNIFRVKGIISFKDLPERYVCHAVQSNLTVEAAEAWGDEARFCKLVFIGKKIDRNKLEDSLYQLLF